MANTDTPARHVLFRRLSTALTSHSHGSHREHLARYLLRHASSGQQLLGITKEDHEAVFFDPELCCVYQLPVSRLGIHPTETTIDWRYVADPDSWIDHNMECLTWCHPRYQMRDRGEDSCWRYHIGGADSTHYI